MTFGRSESLSSRQAPINPEASKVPVPVVVDRMGRKLRAQALVARAREVVEAHDTGARRRASDD